jgi:hypothetical protein
MILMLGRMQGGDHGGPLPAFRKTRNPAVDLGPQVLRQDVLGFHSAQSLRRTHD